ncbi:MAG: hypothetical protein RIR26_2307 [Pseudomonadota bacterium]|jgi:tetratricopeptide (TPR) repeat protein
MRIGFSEIFFGFTAVAVLQVAGCASLKVSSQPSGAEVYLIESNNSEPKMLGKTPLEGSVSEMVKSSAGGPVVVQLRLTGYLPQSFLVPSLGGQYSVDAKMERNLFASYEDINKIVRLSFLAERQILQKQYEEVLKTADRLQAINENVSLIYQIKGTVQFIQGKMNESRMSLMRVLELDPDNAEVRSMLTNVENKLGFKAELPATQTPATSQSNKSLPAPPPAAKK